MYDKFYNQILHNKGNNHTGVAISILILDLILSYQGSIPCSYSYLIITILIN